MVLCALGAACGRDGGDDGARTDDPGRRERAAAVEQPQVYEGTVYVLSSPEHGPEACTPMLTSLPPQCGGLPVVGWDWEAVEGETVDGSTISGLYHITGTYARDAFTLTETPGPPEPEEQGALFDLSQACDTPDPFVLNVMVRPGSGPAATAAIRQAYPGPLCVVEQDTPTEAELHALQAEVGDPAAREALPLVGTYSDWQRGVVVAQIWAVEPASTAYAQDRGGDRVELRGQLDPVDV